jgi:predicted lipoprotein with Yx(FWY)xxD motif
MTLRTVTAIFALALMALPATLAYAQSMPAGTASTGLGTVLVDANSMTLYTFGSDSANTSACSGGCAGAWPPAVVDADTAAMVAGGSAGMAELGVFDRGDGMQLTWNGMPLYRFVRDTAAGQTNGEGVNGFGGLWSAVRVTS